MSIKSGFISVIGRTNAGKSTMINSLLGEDICFCSHKENATRRKMNVVVMHDEHQLIFVDTPGLHESNKSFNQLLIETAKKSMDECDLIVFVMSVFDDLDDYVKFLALNPKVPHVVVINKFDLASKEQQFSVLARFNQLKSVPCVIPFSCKIESLRKTLLDELVKLLPVHPYYFEPDFSTDRALKDVLRDLILESVFANLNDELPYKTEVIVNQVKEKNLEFFINADLISDGRKHMIIGKNAATIKRISISARKRISSYLGTRVHLRLFAKDRKGWQSDNELLKTLKIAY